MDNGHHTEQEACGIRWQRDEPRDHLNVWTCTLPKGHEGDCDFLGETPGGTNTEQQTEAALAAIYVLRRAKDESSNGLTANARFIDQEVLVALGELERAFLPDEGTPVA